MIESPEYVIGSLSSYLMVLRILLFFYKKVFYHFQSSEIESCLDHVLLPGRRLHHGGQSSDGVLAERNRVPGHGVFHCGPDARRELGAVAYPRGVHQANVDVMRKRGGRQPAAGHVQPGEDRGPH